VIVAAALGYGTAAVITPVATSWLPAGSLITILLVMAGVVAGPLGATFSQVPFLIISFAVGVAAQGIAITATTIIQQEVDDGFRGRVFSFYDMLFNAPFVIGAAVSAAFMPFNGKSYPLLGVAGAGYVLAALGYALLSRQRPAGGSESSPAGGSESSPAGDSSSSAPAISPSAAAQRNSS
jgi:hypothetical protein